MADAPPSTPVAQVATQAGKPPAPAAASGFVGHAALVSALTLVSRVTGLLRDAALASGLGRGPVADAFIFGFQVPNLFRRLFGEGAFSAAFIPAYTRLVRDDPVLARRFASLCLGLLIVVLGAITLLGEALLAAMVAHFPWTQDTALALRLTMIMLPYMPMICLVAILGAMLQVHGRFGSPAAAPILLNLIMIAAILLATRGELSDDQLRHAVRIVAWSVVAAGAAQVIWQTLAVLRVESFTAQLAGTGPAVRSMLRVFVPVVLGLAVFQINTFFDNVLAMALSPKDGQATLHLLGLSLPRPLEKGSVVALAFAQRLYEFPLGIFGIAIATAIFPALAQAAPAGKAGRPSAASQADEADETDSRHLERFAQVLRHGLRLSVFIGLPASVGLILVRVPLARVVFERQAFTLQDSLAVATILAGYA
ncbi:MAG TPA: murein biosynthesis integral membrane protein MurJ, partial [Phycisphaeraceae bacterium]